MAFECLRAAEGPATDALGGQRGEPALDLIQPRGAGRAAPGPWEAAAVCDRAPGSETFHRRTGPERRTLHCVASRGFVSSVCTRIRSTSASRILRGAPGRGSSSRPSSRWSMKRCRHFPHHLLRHAQLRRDFDVGSPHTAQQHDACAQRERLRRLPSPCPSLQGL